MDPEIKDKGFFEDENIEEELTKLEAEMEEADESEKDADQPEPEPEKDEWAQLEAKAEEAGESAKDADQPEPEKDEWAQLEAKAEEAGESAKDADQPEPEDELDKSLEAVELDRLGDTTDAEKRNTEQEAIDDSEAGTAGFDPTETPGPEPRRRTNKKLIGLCAAGIVVVLSFAIYITTGKQAKQKDTAVYGSIREQIDSCSAEVTVLDSSLTLSSFVIPLGERAGKAYLFLTISIRPPNNKVYREIEEKRTLVRGVLYDLFRGISIRGNIETMPRKELEARTVNVLNGLLSSGKLEDVCFVEFFSA